MRRLAAVCVLGLAVGVPTAGAANCSAVVNQLENELMCPTCQGETLSQSDAPVAQRIEAFAHRQCRAGASKGQIKSALVSQFGESILAAPPKKGFDLLAWLLPLVGIALGAVVIGVLAHRWARAREPAPAPVGLNGHPLPPEWERRVDEELGRFD